MGRFDGKVVIVTGASSGIGESTAKAFAKEGANLTITGRNQDRLSAVAQECRESGAKVLELVCDMADFDALESIVTKTVDMFNALDILVNNAGAFHMGPVEQLQLEDYEKTMQVNVRGPIFLCKFALPHLRKTKECAGDGVRINCVNPGIVVTRILNSVLPEEEVEAARGENLKNQPLGPLYGDDIAASILHLCEAKGVTGTHLVVDGGFLLQ